MNIEDMGYTRDAIIAIISYSNYEALGLEDSYTTPAESYDREGMKKAEEEVDQIINLPYLESYARYQAKYQAIANTATDKAKLVILNEMTSALTGNTEKERLEQLVILHDELAKMVDKP